MTDVLLNKSNGYFYDIAIKDGDIAIGDSDNQNIEHILLAYPGSYKQNPFIGVGVLKMLNANFGEEQLREINLQLLSDDITNVEINYIDEKLHISPKG